MQIKNWLFTLPLVVLLYLPAGLSGQVTADFSSNPNSGCSPLVVSFTDLSTGPVTTWFWDFGNGNTSTLQNPAAVYVTPGTYTVSLTVTDGGANSDTRTRTNLITVFQDPTANFGATTPVNGCAPHTVTFQDLSTPGSGTINQWLWDFGDGQNSALQNPSHTFANPGSYNITLVVTDNNGCSNTFLISNYVNVSNAPTAGFSGAPTGGCNAPLNVSFTNTSTGGAAPVSFSWDFGDGNTSTAQNPSHTYTANGSYDVSLIATDANGCADTLTFTNYININPITADFSSGTTVCAGTPLGFTDLSTGNPNTWAWDFGDGNTSNQQNPTHTYATAGTYTVTLTASRGPCNDAITRTNHVTVTPAPTADFVGDTLIACSLPFTVNFSDLSVSGGPAITGWAWDFGDGNTSTAQNPTHTYTGPGTYDVTLTVTDAGGCTSTLTFNNYIDIQLPVANFVGAPLTGCVPLNVAFTDQSVSNFPITGWEWDFGDGNTSTAQNPNHTYTAAGQFDVTLIITTASGCTDTLTRINYIEAGNPPIASFSATPLTPCANEDVFFTDLSVNATSWLWDFGDGGTSTAQNPTYAYQDTGCFTVTLTVSNFGCTDDTVITNYICVSPPVAIFNLNPAAGCAIPHTVFFTDQSILPDTWLWRFGDGNTSTLQNPVHNYTATGNYGVTLIVEDTITGCIDSAQGNVTVSIPTADFTGAPLFGCGPLTVNFTDASTGNPSAITGWNWDFGDGNTSTAQNPTYTYNTPGVYTVTLTVTDANGCTDTRTRTNYVQVIGPDVNFGADTLGGCNPLTVNFTDSTIFGAPITSWTWDFGDGNNSNLQNPTHTYTTTGTYNVSLTVTDIDGCTRTFTRNAYIQVTDPTAGFTTNDTLACVGSPISFTNTSAGVGLSYQWDFGDGNTSTATNPTHTYALEDSFDIQLIATDVWGCTDTASAVNEVVIENPQANFSAAPTNASCPPLLVSFTDISTPSADIVAWEWDFGDGTGSVLQNPSHVYATAGSFDVTLIVQSGSGCSDTLLMPGLVNILGPNGNFTFFPDSGCTPLTVGFNATATNTATYTWDFGDGNVAITTVDSVQHTYTQTGQFYPILILDDGLGCTFSILSPDSINVDTIPIVDFVVDTSLICDLDSVRFTDLTVSTRPITSWAWDFGDGNTDTLQNPVHFYNSIGNYDVQLTVTNNLGCVDSITIPSAVGRYNPPTADFTVTDSVGCSPLLVNFTDASTGPQTVTRWRWDLSLVTSNQQNPFATFVTPQLYNITLAIEDSVGCVDTAYGTIRVTPGPTASFSADQEVGCPPLPVTFTAGTGMGIVAWDWDFGDGNTGTDSTVSHTYTSPGDYTVTLVVTDTLGCTDTLTRIDYIHISPPIADFNPDITSGCPVLNVTFTDATVSDTTLVSWEWDFGDGTTGTGNPVSHPYDSAGTFTVTLIVTDVIGCRDTLTRNNLITVFQPPTANFGPQDTIHCAPMDVPFRDSSAAVTSLTGWDWLFGNGNGSTAQNPVATYANPGFYSVRLIVTDANTCQDTAFTTVQVNPGPTATFTADDSTGCPPFGVLFTAGAGQGIVNYDWDFGDLTTGNGNPVSHTYPLPGDYTVSLIVTDTLGCMDTLVKPDYIYIHPPTADFSANVTSGCPPLTVTFTDNSVFDTTVVAWDWDFGDGNSGTGTPVTHTYTNPGLYDVTLIITDVIGCQDTLSRPAYIEVFQPPTSLFGITDTLGCIPFTIQLDDSSSGVVPITGWEWDFGDASPVSNLQNPSHGYAAPGNYLITLIVTDANGCMDTSTFNFTAPVLPQADFTQSDSLLCDPTGVTFTAVNDPAITGFSWTFGDGNSDVGNPVTHTYTRRGKFAVSLIIDDIYGCSDTLIKPELIFIDSLMADFTVDVTSGCTPQVVTFTDQSYSDTTITWAWDFGDGNTSTQQNPAHNYNSAGDYTARLIVTNAFGCIDTAFSSLITIYDATAPSPPPIRVASVISNSADSIAWNSYTGATPFSHYVLYRENPTGSGVYQPVDSFFTLTDTTYIDNGLNTLQQHHCYKLVVVTICGARSALAPYQEHCTINLTATPGIDENNLTWTPYVGWGTVQRYEVFRVTDYNTGNATQIGQVNGSTTTFRDTAVTCNVTYYYRVMAVEAGGLSQVSWSDTSGATPIYIPNQLPGEVVTATVENNDDVRVDWLPPPIPNAVEIYLERSLDDNSYQLINALPASFTTFLDTAVEVQTTSYYYKISVLDACGDVSPLSNHGRSIVLRAESEPGFVFLDWNEYTEWQNGVDFYEIEVFNETTQQWQFVDQVPGNTLRYVDNETDLGQLEYCYQVRANEVGGNSAKSLSNQACVPVGPGLFVPTGFTPNGDGINEFFLPKGYWLNTYHLQIFNRWGVVIWETNNLDEGWPGTHKGTPVQEGVYVWKINATGFDGTIIERAGTATLVR